MISLLIARYPHTELKHWTFLLGYDVHFVTATVFSLLLHFISAMKYPADTFLRVSGPFGVCFVTDSDTKTRIHYPTSHIDDKRHQKAYAYIMSNKKPHIKTAAYFYVENDQVRLAQMASGSFPLVLLVSSKNMVWFAQDLASRGFVVAEIKSRGHEAEELSARLLNTIIGTCLEELQSNLSILKGGVDLGRIAAIGFGPGANAVLNATARDRRIKAAIRYVSS